MTAASSGRMLLRRLGPSVAEDDDLQLRLDEPMARHCTLRLGGPADLWARPQTEAALARLLGQAHANDIPVTFVGGGSNLLCLDGGIRGIAINCNRLNEVWRPDPEQAPHELEVQAGASTGRLLRQATELGLGGLEFLGGVPGSVGGGLIMNAGTYLGEFKDVVTTVRSLRLDGSAVARDHAACRFRYRASDLPRDEVIVATRLRCWARPRAEIEADVAELRQRRRAREPHGVPNSGSTFKNPPGDYAGRLIETAELKGTRVGGAFVSPVHANWLVVDKAATPPAKAADLLALIELVRNRVHEVHGVWLELEIKIVGEPKDAGSPAQPC